ncbi:MAG: flagellar biosynthesis protein FlhB, partial [Chromatiales bacterium]|nr:flagellar biosynthesis protein FlhB [Chromatiales bacterium]
FMAVMMLTAALVPMMLGGWTLSAKALSFQWERIDPVKGIGRVFSIKGLVELLKSLLKFSFMGFVGGLWLWHAAPQYMQLGGSALGTGTGDASEFIMAAFLVAVLPMAIIAAIDVPYQLWDHARQLRMSPRELKDEMKETDGSPELKARIRRQQQELSQRRMMQAVPDADVIIVNPSHYAVALRYDVSSMSAPVLVAKGVDHMAMRIREVGTACAVPLVRSPLLARGLYYNAKLDREIPAALYMAVAQVLAYVLRLTGDGVSLDRAGLENLTVPDGLRTE